MSKLVIYVKSCQKIKVTEKIHQNVKYPFAMIIIFNEICLTSMHPEFPYVMKEIAQNKMKLNTFCICMKEQ